VSLLYHSSVLTDQVVEALQPETASVIVDATLGDGGHSYALLQKMAGHGRVIGLDMDQDALARSRERLQSFGDRFLAVPGNFRDLKKILQDAGFSQIDGVLADLGVSFLQISNPGKGFMFSASGPLRMQMDPERTLDAEQVVNEYEEKELADLIWQYGEERHSRRIAAALVRQRQKNRIQTTEALAQIIRQVIKGPQTVKSLARVFQALRIHVNGEMENLDALLPQTLQVLRPGGRAVFISYHSLEDKKVKSFIHAHAHPCICPIDLPLCACGRQADVKAVGRSILADDAEVERNKSSRSARLRVLEKI
jgi:16S rRNA (cytosine1402-N4)-methyltransferase